MSDYTPTKADRFSFGLWTVGWQGVDPLGARGCGVERLDQLAMDHLFGTR